MRYFNVSITGYKYSVGAANEEQARYALRDYFNKENEGLIIPVYPTISEENLNKIAVSEITKEEFDTENIEESILRTNSSTINFDKINSCLNNICKYKELSMKIVSKFFKKNDKGILKADRCLEDIIKQELKLLNITDEDEVECEKCVIEETIYLALLNYYLTEKYELSKEDIEYILNVFTDYGFEERKHNFSYEELYENLMLFNEAFDVFENKEKAFEDCSDFYDYYQMNNEDRQLEESKYEYFINNYMELPSKKYISDLVFDV